jgi:hypothetical protein
MLFGARRRRVLGWLRQQVKAPLCSALLMPRRLATALLPVLKSVFAKHANDRVRKARRRMWAKLRRACSHRAPLLLRHHHLYSVHLLCQRALPILRQERATALRRQFKSVFARRVSVSRGAMRQLRQHPHHRQSNVQPSHKLLPQLLPQANFLRPPKTPLHQGIARPRPFVIAFKRRANEMLPGQVCQQPLLHQRRIFKLQPTLIRQTLVRRRRFASELNRHVCKGKVRLWKNQRLRSFPPIRVMQILVLPSRFASALRRIAPNAPL